THLCDQLFFLLPFFLFFFVIKVVATDANFKTEKNTRPDGYLLRGLKQPKDLHKRPSLELNNQPIILSPYDNEWLADDECFVVSQVQLSLLAGSGNWRQFSSTPELVAALKNPSVKYRSGVQVELHSRLVQPFLDMTLLLLGLPVVLSRQSRNLFLSVGLCVLLIVVFMSVVLLCHHIGSSTSLNPSLAAWCPLMIFVPMTVAFSTPLRE
ncbi:MAG: LptF/LptG family permease, partial [Planctomycetales bacterium]